MTTPNDPKARVVEIIDAWEKEAKDQERPAFWEDFIDRLDSAGLLASAPVVPSVDELMKGIGITNPIYRWREVYVDAITRVRNHLLTIGWREK